MARSQPTPQTGTGESAGRGADAAPGAASAVAVLAGRGPTRAGELIGFLSARAVPGLESVTGGVFRRHLPGGVVELTATPGSDHLELRYRPRPGRPWPDHDEFGRIVALVRRVADLDTDLTPIAGHLGADAVLGPRVAAAGVGRRPGAFDPFELAVRAVVGQQVSVAAARTLLGRLVRTVTAGGPGDDPGPGWSVSAFPGPDAVAAADLDQLGMPARRRATIVALARGVADGRVDLTTDDPDRLRHQLLAVPGIGPWTAGYVALRLGPDGDGWPSGDLVLRQSLGLGARELERHSQHWRPWRAYAALVLWRTATVPTPATPASPASPAVEP